MAAPSTTFDTGVSVVAPMGTPKTLKKLVPSTVPSNCSVVPAENVPRRSIDQDVTPAPKTATTVEPAPEADVMLPAAETSRILVGSVDWLEAMTTGRLFAIVAFPCAGVCVSMFARCPASKANPVMAAGGVGAVCLVALSTTGTDTAAQAVPGVDIWA